MQIIIDIDEDLYDHIKNSYILCSGMRTGKSFIAVIFNAIANGTPLPKRHGDLIDRNELKKVINQFDCYDQVLDAQTIIEADKEDK